MRSGVPLAGVMGWPAAHSMSPKVHGHWLARYGLAGAYVPLEVGAEDFAAVLAAMPRMGFVGANVTMPHKGAAHDLADERSGMAARLGAANTLVFDPARGVVADNTDGFGFIENLREARPGWDAGAGPAVVLGAGGASRAVIAALLDAGVPELRLLNRTREKAEALREEIAPGIAVLDWAEAEDALAGAALAVNATSMGMAGGPAMTLRMDALSPDAVATDIVYSRDETPFLTAARARGAKTVDGFGMLLHQARPGFERWFGRAPVVDDDLRHAVLGTMIVLGLTGSIAMGKSTTAAMFAEAGAPVWDADGAVHEAYGPGGAAVEPVGALVPGAAGPGGLDREALRRAIAADPDLLTRIERIVHPIVGADRGAFLDAAQAGGAAVAVLDIPLLFETGGDAHVDRVVVVTCDPATQRARALAREGMSAARFDAILARQVPDAEKRARADFIVETDAGLAAARARVGEILGDVAARA